MKNPKIISSYKNEDGYWEDPKSKCCGAPIVYYLNYVDKYVTWFGSDVDECVDLKCGFCNEKLNNEIC